MLSCFSYVPLFVTPWIIAHQDPLSMGFSKHEYWSGLPCSPPGDLPNPGIKPASTVAPALQADSLPLSHEGSLYVCVYIYISTHIYHIFFIHSSAEGHLGCFHILAIKSELAKCHVNYLRTWSRGNSESESLGWNLRVCTSHKPPANAKAAVSRSKLSRKALRLSLPTRLCVSQGEGPCVL